MLKENADVANFIITIVIISKKDEVMDKMPKQPMTHTSTQSNQSSNKR
jgi:hypothetical protein